VPQLQTEQGVVRFFRDHRGQRLPSAAPMNPMSRSFVAALESFVARHRLPLVQFRSGERNDDVMAEHLHQFGKEEGVLFIGKAQEKTKVFRTEKRTSPTTGKSYPWIVRSTAMVNQCGRPGEPREKSALNNATRFLISSSAEACPRPIRRGDS
jgi:hypothetical protein